MSDAQTMDPLLLDKLPKEVTDAAIILDDYFAGKYVKEWQLFGCCSRNYAFKCERLEDELIRVRAALIEKLDS